MKNYIKLLHFIFLITNFMFLGCSSEPNFKSDWEQQVDRTWIGPEFWGNRLQDWQIKDGRLECIESEENRPMRVLHLLTESVSDRNGNIEMNVLTGIIDSGNVDEHSWTGFLIGTGSKDIDYRLSALAHHRPAEDGGIFVGIDGTGRINFRDFSKGSGGSPWSIIGNVPDEDFIWIEADEKTGTGFPEKEFKSVILSLKIESIPDANTIILSVKDPDSNEIISEAKLKNVPTNQIEGNVGLVSHHGPKNSKSGFWFNNWSIRGSKLDVHPERTYGPILCAQHTISKGTLKITAQMPPLGVEDNKNAEFQIKKDGTNWETVSTAELQADSYIFPFRVDNWNVVTDKEYRIKYDMKVAKNTVEPFYWTGIIRKDPVDKDSIVVAAFTGHKIFTGGLKWNHGGIWFPHNEMVAAVSYQNPDLLFFSGDQIYESDLTGTQIEPYDKAVLDYLDKWYRWCWAFGDLARDIPTVCITDDHDVYHGNIWGAGGRKKRDLPVDGKYPKQYESIKHAWQQDGGGYKMSADFVNMVQATQASHLPDPYDPTPVEQGIGVYYTDLLYGGISFAVLEDRKWKSSPSLMLPDALVVNGFIQNPKFDKTKTDNPDAILLGDRQLKFLNEWGADWKNSWMKVVLSQTIFANVSTYPNHFSTDQGTTEIKPLPFGEIPKNYDLAIDMDSNGWPQTARNKAVEVIRKAFAFHIAGDQHLGSTVQYGVDNWRDAGYAVCVPSIGNTWPRRWYPQKEGLNYKPGNPKYTGDYKDGFGNLMSVYAVSNPILSNHEPAGLYDRAPGYGIIRFEKKSRDITIEVWPRWVDPSEEGAKQYPGWPIKINQYDNFGESANYYLPTIKTENSEDCLLQVKDEKNDQIVFTLRINGNSFQPKVFEKGKYSIKISNSGIEKHFKNVEAVLNSNKSELSIKFN